MEKRVFNSDGHIKNLEYEIQTLKNSIEGEKKLNKEYLSKIEELTITTKNLTNYTDELKNSNMN